MAERARRGIAAALLLLLSSCGGSPSTPDKDGTAPAAAANESASGLEALAEDSGVLGEQAAASDPVGSYGQAYEGGEDRLCVLPATGSDHSHAFALEIRVGEEEYCRGKGRAIRAGNSLTLRFAGGRCIVTGRYEGDRILLPGTVDRGCASLCSARGSLAGVSFPRIGMDANAARAVIGGDGVALCGK